MSEQLTDLERDLLEMEELCNHCQTYSCHHWVKCPKLGSDVSGCRILSIPQSAQSDPLSSSVYSQSDFHVSEESEDFFFADWPLVGHGVKHASCGTFWTLVCMEKHDPLELPEGISYQKHLDGTCAKDGVFLQRIKMTCHRPICPECWPDWRRRQVARVKDRFEAFEKGFNRAEKRHLKRCHGTISVPKKFWRWPQAKMKRFALKYLRELGVNGGSIIYHSKRRREKIKTWYYSPHFHVFFHAWNAWVDGEVVKRWSKRTGWVFKNFGERDLTRSISYQLGHAAVPPNHGHVVTWFGSMNYRLLHVEQWHGERVKCPWGHVMDRYGVYLGKEKLELPEKDGYQAYLPRDGWLLLPKKRKKDSYDYGYGDDG